jgi:hypothetical protein
MPTRRVEVAFCDFPNSVNGFIITCKLWHTVASHHAITYHPEFETRNWRIFIVYLALVWLVYILIVTLTQPNIITLYFIKEGVNTT